MNHLSIPDQKLILELAQLSRWTFIPDDPCEDVSCGADVPSKMKDSYL